MKRSETPQKACETVESFCGVTSIMISSGNHFVCVGLRSFTSSLNMLCAIHSCKWLNDKNMFVKINDETLLEITNL